MKTKSSKLFCTDKERSNPSSFRFSGCSNRCFVLPYPHIMFTDPRKVEEKCKDSYDEQNSCFVWSKNEEKRKKPKLVLDMTFVVQDARPDTLMSLQQNDVPRKTCLQSSLRRQKDI